MQLYSGLIFKGPGVFGEIHDEIKSAMEYFGAVDLEELTEMIFEEQLNLPNDLGGKQGVDHIL